MSITLSALQKQRRDTAANWTTANPTLLAGEIGIESDTGEWKVGDGATAWTSLAYVPAFSISAYPLVNADISATAEIAVSKLADGSARQLLQTDAAGTGVEWASNIDVPGTLDVTGVATFDGIASHPAGSASAPSIIFTGDTNTGIYSPGADQWAVSTGGTGRLFIASDGNIGVGVIPTTAEVGKVTLDVSGPLLARGAVSGHQTSAGVFQHSSNITAIRSYGATAGSGVITFSTGGGGSADTERMRLDSSGRLGLGTSSPQATLDVNGTIYFRNSSIKGIISNPSSDIFDIGNAGGGATNPITFSTQSIERVRITNTGNVGIGTQTPGMKLTVNDTTTAQIQFGYSDSIYGRIGRDSSGNYEFSSYENGGNLKFGTTTSTGSTTERARIDSSGRLLVGTSSSVDGWKQQIVDSDTQNLSLFTGRADLNGPRLGLKKSRGSTASPSIVSSGDSVGTVGFFGYDGTTYIDAATIKAEVDGTPGTNDMPCRLVFSVTKDGQASPSEAMRIRSDLVTLFSGAIAPTADNAFSNGGASNRWTVIYAATGTINTSDASLKQDIEGLDDAELSVATALKGLIKKFRFKDAVEVKGDDARIHVGVIAQEVEQAFVDAGLDPRRYGMFCEDELEDGSKRLGIRYDELLAFVVAAL